MKAISIKDTKTHQWATWIEQGEKRIEVRTWKPRYRGDLLICCSKSSPTPNTGLAIAIVELIAITDWYPGMIEDAKVTPEQISQFGKSERPVYAWHLDNLRHLSPKFHVRGRLSLYEVEIPKGIEIVPASTTYHSINQ